MPRQVIDLLGLTFGRLTVVSRNFDPEYRTTHAMWNVMCTCGNSKVVRGNHLRNGQVSSCGCLVVETLVKQNIARRQQQPSYIAMHGRLNRDQGSATEFSCKHCGKSAVQWAYDHTDPDHYLSSVPGSPTPMLVSSDPKKYIPLCFVCHSFMDAFFRKYPDGDFEACINSQGES